MYSADPGFESGTIGSWELAWPSSAGTLEVKAAAAKDGNYGIHITANGTDNAGLVLNKFAAPQIVGAGQNRRFKFSYDVKFNSYAGTGKNRPSRLYFVANTWGLRVEKWHSEVQSGEWTHIEIEFDEVDWTSELDPGRLEIQFIAGQGAIDAYIDNLRLEEIARPTTPL